MPSTPSLFEFSGLTTPGRAAQARSGRPRPHAWRSRGSRFYCVGTIAFDHAIVDFESLSVVFLGQKYLLALSPFLMFVRLLFAEGNVVSRADLADAIGLAPEATRGATVTRHLQRLQHALDLHGQGRLLVRRRGLYALASGPVSDWRREPT